MLSKNKELRDYNALVSLQMILRLTWTVPCLWDDTDWDNHDRRKQYGCYLDFFLGDFFDLPMRKGAA